MPNSLEDWAFTATIAAGFTTVVLSIVVFVQLRLAIRQTRALKDQVQLARESQEQTAESLRISAIAADAARDQVNISDNALQIARESLEQTSESVRIASQAADAARDAALETARARIDDHSPRVVAWDWRPTWPPFLDTVSSYTYQNTPAYRLDLPPNPIDPDREFRFPADRELFLWFRICGVIKNEGSTTGRVTLGGDARLIDGTHPQFPGIQFRVPPVTGMYRAAIFGYTGEQYILEPGAMGLFEWAAGFTVGEWADQTPEIAAADELTIRVQGTSEDGIIDTIRVRFGARPLAPVTGHDGGWRLASEDDTGVVTFPAAREYRSFQTPPEQAATS